MHFIYDCAHGAETSTSATATVAFPPLDIIQYQCHCKTMKLRSLGQGENIDTKALISPQYRDHKAYCIDLPTNKIPVIGALERVDSDISSYGNDSRALP